MFMKINDYGDFINEEFFKKIFGQSKKKTTSKNPVDSCVENILNFLSENDVYNWDHFLKLPLFDRDVIDKLIDSEVRTMKDLQEVRFKLKLELMNKKQLNQLRNEYEVAEEYEKCALVVKKMSQK